MTGENGKRVIYDWRKEVRIAQGEGGEETTAGESTHGEYPSCFSEDWSKGPSAPSSQVNFQERGCTCGKHVLYWMRIPEEFWPENYEERVRVIEKS